MAYLGNSLTVQQYTPNITYFSGNGSTTTFTLPYAVVTAAQVLIHVDNVSQNPSTAFSISGTTLTFTSAPLTGTNNIWVEYTSLQSSVNALPASPSIVGPMYVGINGATPIGGATNPIVGMSGAANNYVQAYVNNNTNAANSSADFVAYPSNGTDAAGWIDMGITGPTYSQALYSVTGPNESYVFASAPSGSGTSGNLVLATDSTGTANAIQFYTGGFTQAKSAARMTIDGSGNVGIGITPPAYNTYNSLTVQNMSLASYSNGDNRIVNNAYYSSGTWYYQATRPASYQSLSYDGGGATFIWQTAPSGTAGTAVTWSERMRIDSSGNLLVGKTALPSSSVYGFAVNASSNNFQYLMNSVGTTGGGTQFEFYNPNGKVGSITTSGSATTYGTSSDYRLKENIAPMTRALNVVQLLKPVTYNWKVDGSEGQGFIAHELQEVVPECVIGGKDAVDAEGKPIYQGIDTSFLVATLTAAIQEQQAIIEDFKVRIETLEAK